METNSKPLVLAQSLDDQAPASLVRHWTQMRSTYQSQRKVFDLAESAISAVYAIPKAARQSEHGLLPAVRIELLRRIQSGLESVVLLAPAGMVREATIQYRSMLEALFKLSALCLDAGLLYPFLAQELIDARRVLKDFKKLRAKAGAGQNEIPTDSQIHEYEARIDSDMSDLESAAGGKLVELSSWTWADKGGLQEVYWAEYARRSQAVHHSFADFGWRSTDVVDYKAGARTLPGALPVEAVVLSATKALLLGTHAVCRAFSLNVPPELAAVDREVVLLYAKATNA